MNKKFLIIIALFVSIFAFEQNAFSKSYEKQKTVKMPNIKVQKFLDKGVWRINNCQENGNFQAFSFKNNKPLVEVGYGIIGEGEKLDILNAQLKGNLLLIETQVCAPIGCNHTFEQYKIISKDKMSEWVFEGHLDNEPPNIVVKDGFDNNGNLGRVFIRCNK